MKKVTFLLIALLVFCWQSDAQTIVIGTGTSTTTSTGSDPIDGYFNAFRYQAVYTAAELNASLTPNDEITALGWSIAGDYGGGALLGYTIKMGHTTATNSAVHDASPTTVVKNAFDYNPTVTTAGVFDMITFDTNFVWNGVDNVLVEVCSDGQNPFSSPYGQVRTTTQTSGSRFYRVDNGTACATNTNTTNGNRPNVQFNYIDGIPPACLNISGLTIDSFGETDVTVSWTPSGSAETDWEIIVQEVAVADPGSGDSGTPINATTDSAPPYTVGSLTPATDYEVFVRSYCGGSDYGAWIGPQNFTTTTPPTSVDCTGLPVNATYCYGDNDTSSFTYQSTDGSTLRVTFNSGTIEDCCDDLIILDSDGVTNLYPAAAPAGGDLTGLIFTSTGDSITIAVNSDGSVSCAGDASETTWDWNVECLSCTPAVVASTDVIENCGAGTYDLQVTFSDLGDAAFLVGTTDPFPFEIIVPGTLVYTLPGYTSGTVAQYSVSHTGPVCDFDEGPFQDACPPDNDLCTAATAIACDDTLSGTTNGATGGSATSCDGTIGDDVWYQYTGDDSTVTLTVNTDGEGAQIGVYESTDGTCSGFTLGTCYASEAGGSATEFVTFDADIGTEYFIQVGHWINGDPAFNFEIAATCVPYPVDPPNCDSTLTSATVDFPVNGSLTWSDATGSPDGYKVTIGSSTGGTDIANSVDVGDTTSYSPTGLNYATTYYVTITPYNFNGDATSCTEQTFDTVGLPPAGYVCESAIDVSAIPYTALAETTAGFGDDYSGSPGASGCGSTSPYLNGDDIFYAFTAAADGSINIDLTNITDTYTGVFIYDDCADVGVACAAGDVNANATADLSISNHPVTNGNTYYIVVSTWATPQSTTYDLSITAGASCVGVSDLTVDTLTSDTVTLSWTANSGETAWEVAIQPDGTGEPAAADGSGTDTTSNPYTSPLTLTPSTDYEAWVRAECTAGTEFGDWTVVYFTTPCEIYTPDYIEDFTTFLDECWEEAEGGDLTAGPASFGAGGWASEEFAHLSASGGGAVNINMFLGGPDIDWLLSPIFDLSADGYEVVVDVAMTDYNATSQADGFNPGDEVRLVYSNDGTNWITLVQWDDTNVPAAAGQTDTVDLTGITGTNVQFAIYVSEGTTGRDIDFHVDNFRVRTPPSCPDVSAITVPTVSPTSADIVWTAGAGETAWEVAVVADGAGTPDVAPGTGVATATTSYTASVSPQTDYDVYVRANCGGTYGLWVGPISFSTPCPVFVPNYTEDFATFLDECWEEANGGDLTAGPASFGTGGWGAEEFAHLSTSGLGAVNINMFLGGPDIDWLLSPAFDLSADGYELLIDVAMTDYNATSQADGFNPGDEVRLVYSNDGTNWTTLVQWDDTNVPAASGQTETVDLTGITGTNVQFALYVSEGTTGRDIDFHADNFIVRTPFACTQAVLDAADVVSDCGAGTFNVQVEFVSTGDATDITDGTDTFAITGTSAIAGPYPIGTIVNLDVVHTDVACDFTIPADFTDACPPANDDFANAITFTCADGSVSGDTTSATLDEDDAPDAPGFNSDTDSPNVWYGFLGTGQDLTLSTINASSDFDTEILVFTGSSGNLNFVAAGYDESGAPDYLAEVTFTAEAGIQYWISVEGYNSGDTGLFQMDITCTGVETFVYNDGTWTPSDPTGTTTANDIVVASGNVVMTGDTDCNTFTVRPGGGTTIPSGASVTTAGGFIMESSSVTYSSLILDGTLNGGVSYDRHVNVNGSGETGSNDLISAPLTGQTFSSLATANPNIFNNGSLYLFGPYDKTLGQFVTWAGTETSTLDAGVGYRAATSDNGGVTFTGTPENGPVSTPVVNGGPVQQQWNLVGNPYPSYMDSFNFVQTNLGTFDPVTAGIWGYDGSATNGWTLVNLANAALNPLVAPGQGFFVSAASAGNMNFDPSWRTTGTSDDYIVGRNAEVIYMKLKLSSGTNNFGTDFFFNPNASLGFDLGYDAGFYGDSLPEFSLYSSLVENNTGDKLTLQTVNSTDINEVTIPLGVNAVAGQELRFSITESTLPANVNVYLDDTVANTSTLLNDSDYVITPTSDLSGTGRFFLRTSEDALSTIENDLNLLDIFTLKASDELVVSGQLLDNNTILNLYDIAGRLVLTTKLDSSLLQNRIDVSSINSGVYIVTVQNNSQEKTKKVIID